MNFSHLQYASMSSYDNTFQNKSEQHPFFFPFTSSIVNYIHFQEIPLRFGRGFQKQRFHIQLTYHPEHFINFDHILPYLDHSSLEYRLSVFWSDLRSPQSPKFKFSCIVFFACNTNQVFTQTLQQFHISASISLSANL